MAQQNTKTDTPNLITPNQDPASVVINSTPSANVPIVSGGGDKPLFKRWQFWLVVGCSLLLLINTVAVGYLLVTKKQMAVTIDSDKGDVSEVLTVDVPGISVGVVAQKPQGLQIGAKLQVEPRGTPNIRLGLLEKTPNIIFEGDKGLQWQLGLGTSGLQYGQVGQPAAFSATSENNQVTTTLGNKADSKVVFNGSSVTAPNNLSINNDTLFVNTASRQVGIGSADTKGKTLYVAGSFGTSGTITAGDQILAVNGTAAKPGFAFQGATNSGLFVSGNNISLSAKGTETLRVSPGAAQVLGNLQTDGYVRTGTAANNPSWQLKRLTGTVSGPDMYIPHGVGASNRILIVDAYYLDSSGTAQSIFDYYDNSVVHLVNGIAGRPYTMTIIYASSGAGW